jgi:hypothetical protein
VTYRVSFRANSRAGYGAPASTWSVNGGAFNSVLEAELIETLSGLFLPRKYSVKVGSIMRERKQRFGFHCHIGIQVGFKGNGPFFAQWIIASSASKRNPNSRVVKAG